MNRPSSLTWLFAMLGAAILPWQMPNDGQTLAGLWALGRGDADTASALWQALSHKRWWFWPMVTGVAIAGMGVFLASESRSRARLLLWGGGIALAGLVLQGLAIGVRGWSYGWLEALFGELGTDSSAWGSVRSSPSVRRCS